MLPLFYAVVSQWEQANSTSSVQLPVPDIGAAVHDLLFAGYIAIFTANVLAFTIAIRVSFRRTASLPLRMRILGGVVLCYVAFSIRQLLGGAHSSWQLATALACSLSASLLFLATVNATRTRKLAIAFSEELPSRLIVDGPYRHIRHPFYSAYSLNWLSISIATLDPVVAALSALLHLVYRWMARSEEMRLLESDHREDYRIYMKATGAFIPTTLNGTKNPLPGS